MSRCLPVLLLLVLACLAWLGSALPVDSLAELKKVQTTLEELKAERRGETASLLTLLAFMSIRVNFAFAASLGGNGLVKAGFESKNLIYTEVLTNVGGAYNAETGEFTAPVRGVYYIRFTANAPTNFLMSAVLYKNNAVQLIVHEQPSGEGSDTASNGAALLLERGDKLKLMLWPNTQIWDNNNHHSTFSGFLVYRILLVLLQVSLLILLPSPTETDFSSLLLFPM
uniref:C1q domain-containing protein n=1 Tax=Monopterus albus TaxID=43700 RepID=A0A3Q3Q6U3_MONAL